MLAHQESFLDEHSGLTYGVGRSVPDGGPLRRPRFFSPTQVVLTKGSLNTAKRRRLVERIFEALPRDVEIIDALDTPHNQVAVEGASLLEKHTNGKRILVLGEHLDSVRRSSEDGNVCPNYWHFSPYGFCPYGCQYCYLAGTIGIKFSPTVKIFVNVPEMLEEVDRVARSIGRPTAFFLGKLQDGLALEPLTHYFRTLVPFFADHPYARMTVLTKSSEVETLLDLKPSGNTVLSWSVNPAAICEEFDLDAPAISERLEAMELCSEAGYSIRAIMMPIVPISDWRDHYRVFLREMLARVRLARLTLGGITSYKAANQLMIRKIGVRNAITENMGNETGLGPDGRRRYDRCLRREMYSFIVNEVRRIRPSLRVALCFEDPALCEEVGLEGNIGKCNCVL